MRYTVNYQHQPKDCHRPLDDGDTISIDTENGDDIILLPNVGDYVHITSFSKDDARFSGKVKSKLFSYTKSEDKNYCHINIVVADDEDDWGQLIKE